MFFNTTKQYTHILLIENSAVTTLRAKGEIYSKLYTLQEAMESFAFPAKINSISTEIPQKCSKLYYFLLESLEYSLFIFELVLQREMHESKSQAA